ncbi:hypothetical protein DPMN_036339 [Dreissena polymorpha]|uniref:Uncharacterized protein n=1 Tax=Dreissena polymorpha TaxID=45954 RepID=A0A9D4MAI7_DREPO|nr:hypothetical protein DPMN_036339 [Dreissena polymorpha]
MLFNQQESFSNFHEGRTLNVGCRVKNCLPPCGHVFQQTKIIFELMLDIMKTNVLTKFHEDWTINLASIVLISFCFSHIIKNTPSPGGHISLAFFSDQMWPLEKNVPPPGGYVFQQTRTILDSSKLHGDWTINVASRVLTKKTGPPHGSLDFQQTKTILKLSKISLGQIF